MLYSRLFRSRWRALLFAGSVCWFALDWASSQDDAPPTLAAVQTTDDSAASDWVAPRREEAPAAPAPPHGIIN